MKDLNNRAEGGFKSLNAKAKYQQVNIDIYADLVVTSGIYGFMINNTSFSMLDLTVRLESSDEFQRWRVKSYYFKVNKVNISINVCRIPNSGEYYPKVYLWCETALISQIDISTSPIPMKLKLDSLGTKNYNFEFNKSTSLITELGWTKTSMPSSLLYIGQLEDAIVSGSEDTVKLGRVHISIPVIFRLLDFNSEDSNLRTTIKKGQLFKEVRTKDGIQMIKLKASNDNTK